MIKPIYALNENNRFRRTQREKVTLMVTIGYYIGIVLIMCGFVCAVAPLAFIAEEYAPPRRPLDRASAQHLLITGRRLMLAAVGFAMLGFGLALTVYIGVIVWFLAMISIVLGTESIIKLAASFDV